MLTCLQGDCPQLFYLLHIKRTLQTTVVLGHITGRTLEEGGTSEALIQREQPLKLVEKDPGDDFGFGNSEEMAVEVVSSSKYLGVHLGEDFTWRRKHFQPGKERPLSSPFPQEIEVCWTKGARPDCFL